MIISILAKQAGFYSQLFFLMNHYLTAKKNNINFIVNSSEWLFLYKKGWEDYFENIDIVSSTNCLHNDIQAGHHVSLCSFTITQYKECIKHMYIYNIETQNKILRIKEKINITDYDSIFIRRGDKLSGESNFISVEKYIDVLLKKNPACHTIFLQTDDYKSYLEMKEYIYIKGLQINVITLCKENTLGGMIIFKINKNGIEQAVKSHDINKKYISTVIDNLRNYTSVDQMNKNEIYEHTIDMIIGIDIVLNSNNCICEYSSNVSRFIKLAHKNSDNVYNVNEPEKDIDWNKTICPAHELL